MNLKSLLIVTVICAGCLKKPAELSIDDGEPADITAIEEALAAGFGDINPLQMKKNEFVAEAQTQQIYDIPERIVFQTGTIIDKREVFSDRVDFSILQQLVEYDQNQNQKSSVTQRKISVFTGLQNLKTQDFVSTLAQRYSQHPSIQFCRDLFSDSTVQNAASPILQQNIIANNIRKNLVESTAERSKPLSLESFCSVALACEYIGQCFNFETFTQYEAPPYSVTQSPDCQGLPNCLMKVVTTKFSFVFMDKDSEGNDLRNKILYEIKISPDAPYMARMISQCRQGIVPIDATTKVYAKICDKVTGFQKGDL